eukprot:CAMPEP_0178953798 /NCGR_PEP_ID=MMETSP0789-20121207/8621_1 /TAXON_ID=3005 /ORGANISM="Rhizosolenia setigera, Strain CCMP 1694" /LENGTH=123 /DNA_ID=CAMNT_0020635101 /DNA_START=190 /DNA_END=561 /DNA_ORIENTATION=-
MARKVKEEDTSEDDRIDPNSIELKPGQKFPTPTPGFGDRVFYETLLRQRPDSIMAQEWCVHYGVCPKEEAETLYLAMMQRKGKKVSPSKSPSRKRKKVKVEKEESFDTGLTIGGDEAIGEATL